MSGPDARAVVLAGRRDVDGADQRLGGVGDRGRELVAIKALLRALAAMAHLGIDDRDDPICAGAAMQPRDAVVVDVEVLADQVAQQPVRLGEALIGEQPVGVLDGLQRALGVLGDPREHPLALGPLTPAAIGLLSGLGVIELQRSIEPAGSLWVDRRDRVQQLAHAVANQANSVLGGRGTQHRRRVDDLLDRPGQHPELLRDGQSAFQRQALLAVQQQPRAELG